MKNNKNVSYQACRFTACALAVTTSLTLLPVNVLAKEPGTSKEEVVYINLNTDGSVDEINVVNIFDLEKAGTITDYGSYSELRNMTTEDEVIYDDNTVTITADEADEIYYEGKLNNSSIPWYIEFHYYLDGKEYSAEELAGKSGALKITMSVKENKSYKGDFFDSCALQASFTLDTEKCKNISAEGATIANIGADKQLTYTILPGSETNVTITADVTDFEMAAAAINGVSLALDIDMDTDELTDKVTELMDAIATLHEGTGNLRDGAQALSDGADELNFGADSLKSGADSVNEGALTLNTGISSLSLGVAKVEQALTEVDAQSSTLTTGSAQVLAGLKQLQSGLNSAAPTEEEITALTTASSDTLNGINSMMSALEQLESAVNSNAYKATMKANGGDVDELKAQNTAAAAKVNNIVNELDEQLTNLKAALAQADISMDLFKLESQLAELKGLATLLEANNACLAGAENYLDALNASIDTLIEQLKPLQTGYTAFDTEIQGLAGTLANLPLSEVNTLVEKYSELDQGIQAYTAGVGEILAGTHGASSGASDLLKGSKEFTKGTSALADGADSLANGAGELADGANELADGTNELADGVSTLYEETDGMDTQVSDQIDELMSSISGDDYVPVSFTDADNTVEAVQFVIQTKPIEIEDEKEVVEETTEELSFWDKLLNLFK